jgi:hypothetical protein
MSMYVGPRHVVGNELAQVDTGHQHPGEPLPADIGQVGHHRLQLVLELSVRRRRLFNPWFVPKKEIGLRSTLGWCDASHRHGG